MDRKYNIKLQTVVDALIHKANKLNVDLEISGIHDGDDTGPEEEISVFVLNEDTNTLGIIGTNVIDFPDDDICFFVFNNRLYTYAKEEGFETDDIYNAFDGKVLKKIPMQEFFAIILNN
tara:strand:+ start:123 stop:479 length:357 start_codon:yes stop_codon:yes gene_type:complete